MEKSSYDVLVRSEDINSQNLDSQNKLRMDVIYKIAITNQSTVPGAITEIVDYYDPNYTFKEAYIGKANGEKIGDIEAKEDSKYSDRGNTDYKSLKNAYKTIYLVPGNETKLTNKGEQFIYAKFTVNDVTSALNNNITTLNIAQINGYKTYNSDKDSTIQGQIDIDSTAGNLNISNIAALNWQEITKYQNIQNMYEDITSIAPEVIYKINNSPRTLEGIVFEDETRLEGNVRKGNGQLDREEKGINGVKVELIETKKINNQTIGTIRATTYTKNAGNYSFTGFIPGDYIIRYTYGEDEKTAMTNKEVSAGVTYGGLNDTSYNGQEYQSTTYTKDSNEYWYSNTKIRKSDATDTTESINRVRDYSNKTDDVAIRNHKAEVFHSYIIPQPGHIREERTDTNQSEGISYRKELAKELMENTHRKAQTEIMGFEIEYTTKQTQGGTNLNYNVCNVDFGIAKRPKQELKIDQDIANIKLTLANNEVLINATYTEEGIEHVQWIPENDIGKDEKATVVLDEELMHGAQLEIIYNLTITNTGEANIGTTTAKNIINYVSNNLNYDEQDNLASNGEKLWEIVTQGEIQNNERKTFINNSVIGRNPVVDLSTQSVILKATKNNPLTKALEPGEETTVQLKLRKILSAESTTDDLRYTNMTEIVEIENTEGRYDYGAIPGNQSLYQQPQEHDTSGASKYTSYNENGSIDQRHPQDGTVIIAPPTGSKYIYYTIGVISATILIIGIYALKKYVLSGSKKEI